MADPSRITHDRPATRPPRAPVRSRPPLYADYLADLPLEPARRLGSTRWVAGELLRFLLVAAALIGPVVILWSRK